MPFEFDERVRITLSQEAASREHSETWFLSADCRRMIIDTVIPFFAVSGWSLGKRLDYGADYCRFAHAMMMEHLPYLMNEVTPDQSNPLVNAPSPPGSSFGNASQTCTPQQQPGPQDEEDIEMQPTQQMPPPIPARPIFSNVPIPSPYLQASNGACASQRASVSSLFTCGTIDRSTDGHCPLESDSIELASIPTNKRIDNDVELVDGKMPEDQQTEGAIPGPGSLLNSTDVTRNSQASSSHDLTNNFGTKAHLEELGIRQ